MGRIWKFIRIEYLIEYPRNFEYRIEYRIEYEYPVASNYIRILNGVEVSCLDAASSCRHGHGTCPRRRRQYRRQYKLVIASNFLFTF